VHHSGADVTEIMTVRGHLSRIKGGRLAPQMLPATVVSLTVSDEKTDSMKWNTDWASPDSTTLADAERVLKKYGLWQKVSEQVRDYLSHPTPDKETPKSFSNQPLYYCMVVKTRALWEGAAQRAKALGLTPVLLTTLLNGESREVGRAIASIANEIKLSGNPARPPCALIATGETAVRIQGQPGTGGWRLSGFKRNKSYRDLRTGYGRHRWPDVTGRCAYGWVNAKSGGPKGIRFVSKSHGTRCRNRAAGHRRCGHHRPDRHKRKRSGDLRNFIRV
jgi:glycerate-2-kinase